MAGFDSKQANKIVPAHASVECDIAISLASILCLCLMMSCQHWVAQDDTADLARDLLCFFSHLLCF